MATVKPTILAENIMHKYVDTISSNYTDTDSQTVPEYTADWFDYSWFFIEGTSAYVEVTCTDAESFNCLSWYWFDMPSGQVDIVIKTESTPGAGLDTTLKTFNDVELSLGMKYFDAENIVAGAKVRIRIDMPTAGSNMRVRQLAIGNAVQAPFGQHANAIRPSFPGAYKATNAISANGSIIGRSIVRSMQKDSFTWQFMDETFLQDSWKQLARDMKDHAWFYAWFIDQYPEEIVFAVATNVERPKQMPQPAYRQCTVAYESLSAEDDV